MPKSRQRLVLPPFDPTARYVVTRPFMLSGIAQVPHPEIEFDKSQVNPRRLRQLVGLRKIAPISGSGAAKRQSYLSAMVNAEKQMNAVAEAPDFDFHRALADQAVAHNNAEIAQMEQESDGHSDQPAEALSPSVSERRGAGQAAHPSRRGRAKAR